MKHIRLTVLLLLVVAVAWRHAAAGEGKEHVVRADNLQVRVTPANGRIVGIRFGADEGERAVSGETVLGGCRLEGVRSRILQNGTVEFEKRFVDRTALHRAVVVERLVPSSDSVRWQIEVRGAGKPWSAAIETSLAWREPDADRFWTAWGDPRSNGADWTNPLCPAKWTDREFLYGGHSYFKEPGTFSLPLATILDSKRDVGLSLAGSPEDLILTMKMRTTCRGTLTFSRENHRFAKDNVVRCTYDLTAHAADWRCGVAWLAKRYPTFFQPPVPKASQIAGCGAYTTDVAADQADRLARMAFRVNWKASFDFPFMGMFIPPVASDDEEWTDFASKRMSVARMRRSSEELRRMGFYLLNYFNVTEFGAQTVFPPPPRKAVGDADLWKDSNDFLHGVLGKAILPGNDGKPIRSWEGCVVMDCGEPVYRNFLVAQARKHVEKFPASAGICIDRMDWLWCYNRQRDDGATWCDGGPARSLVVSWHDLMGRMGPVLHDAKKVIFGNPMYARLDLMREIDGFYDEHGQHPHSINTCSLLALYKPYIAWTWELDEIEKNPDDYFQRHLYLGAFLTAPVPGNDHTVLPNAKLDQWFFDYGPLLDTLRGKRWVLLPHVVHVEGDKALANVFEVPGGYVMPVMLGGRETAAKVVLRGLPMLAGQTGFRAEVLRPGESQPVQLSTTAKGRSLSLDVPLKRGCAVLLLTHTWMSPRNAFFHGNVKVELGTTLENAQLHYTLDGSEPTARSPLCTAPLDIKQTTTVKAAAFQRGRMIGRTLEREYVTLDPPTVENGK